MQLKIWDNPEAISADQPVGIKLRPYQGEASDAVVEALRTARSTLVVMPTGTGKTILFADVIRRSTNGRTLVIAHREELIFQAAKKIRQTTNKTVAIEMADRYSDEYDSPADVVVSSIQTQTAGGNGGRMSRFTPDDFSLVVIDEAHHATARSYRKMIQHYQSNPNLKLCGVTATPDRADEEALGQVFDTVAYDYEILDAVRDGWLAPIRQNRIAVAGLDFSSCRTTAGDLNGADLDAIVNEEKILHGFAHPVYEISAGRKTLIFAASVSHAERLAEILNRHQTGCAEWICGKTPTDERRRLLRYYSEGRFQFLVNVGIATEGFDEPGIQVVAIGRPTKSRSLYAQMVGRGTRPLPGVVDGLPDAQSRIRAISASGKAFVEVLDFVGNSGRHKLMSAADILGGKYSDEIVELAEERIEEATREGKTADVAKELEAAERDIHARREAERKRRSSVLGKASWESIATDPFDALDIEPARERAWDRNRSISAKMDAMLKRNGIDTKGLSYTHAAQLIKHILDNPEKIPCTRGQAKVLGPRGYDVSTMTKEQASKLIAKIANNGWRR